MAPVPEGLTEASWRTAGVALLMAIWWITEAIPIYATALIPILMFPLLGVSGVKEATAPYGNPLIYMFLGGFTIAIAMERWGLHRRIALGIVDRAGVKPRSIILGFMIACAFLSLWVSNTATTIMMLPIGLSILKLVEGEEESVRRNFELVLVLSIAYACNIGGIGTLIGTPPNALLAAFALENYGIQISFLRWMSLGIPIVIVGIYVTYLILTRLLYPIQLKELPGGHQVIHDQLKKLGRITREEKRVGIVFVSAALLWICRPLVAVILPGISDTGVAIAAAISFFLIPTGREEGGTILRWEDANRLPWGILLLFGGGMSLATMINQTGLATWVGSGISQINTLPIAVIVILAIGMMVFLTEITSNMASTATFLPILASIALGLGQNPLLLAIPTTLAASCAFMLPVATPPNAIIYGSGKITISQMSRAGLVLNIFFIIFLSIVALTFMAWLFGIEKGIVPEWAR